MSLSGWQYKRRVVVLRRPLRGEIALTDDEADDTQQQFAFIEADHKAGRGITGYEDAVLVTNTDYEVLSLGQLYRDRADAENAFDELKNQWGWGGFATHDLALAYNGWSLLFARRAHPEARREAIPQSPLADVLDAAQDRARRADDGHAVRPAYPLRQGPGNADACLRLGYQGWGAPAAEQLNSVSVWQRVCDHLKQTIAGIGLPKTLRLLEIMQTGSGNCGF